eukprot:77681-Rhodomonas_salina.1
MDPTHGDPTSPSRHGPMCAPPCVWMPTVWRVKEQRRIARRCCSAREALAPQARVAASQRPRAACGTALRAAPQEHVPAPQEHVPDPFPARRFGTVSQKRARRERREATWTMPRTEESAA